MKRFITIVILFASMNIGAFAQSGWFLQNPLPQGTQGDVFFINSNTGWVVGSSGSILRTTNGGTNWTAQTSGTSNGLSEVHFADTNTGWVAGGNDTIRKTTNGGSNWTARSSGTSAYLISVHFADNNTGWAVGDYGTIRKTTNGGSNWTAQTSGTSAVLSSVHFADNNTGWAVGDYGTILTTYNGGATWTARSSGTSAYLHSVHFADNNTGWAVGGIPGIILKTTNGGMNWATQTSVPNGLKSVYFTDGNIGWAVGDYGTILTTYNGGATWTARSSGTIINLYSVYFTDNNTGWAVGGIPGIILKTTNGGIWWTQQSSGTTNHLYSVHFADNSTGWCAGQLGTIQMTTNGGTIWTTQTSGTTNTLSSVHFADNNTGWTAGGNTILKTTNGGTNWTAQTSGTTNGLSSLHFVDNNTGWAVGNSGTIRRTTNGGTNWTAQTSGTSMPFSSVYFANSNTGWVVGNIGTIRRTTNGGTNWTAQTSGTSTHLKSVYFANSNTGWVVGDYGTILTTNNGGATWTPQTSGITVSLLSVDFADNSTGWAVGIYGVILNTTNGGTNWTEQTRLGDNQLKSVYFTDSNTGWTVGYNGTILKYNGIGSASLIITSPNGGETFLNGQQLFITWNSLGVQSVKIEFTSNNGGTWSTLSASYPADSGRFAWTVPNINSTQCKIRISQVGGSLSDISDYPFSIDNNPFAITSPNGNETIINSESNYKHDIKWNCSSNILNVKLEYTTNGTTWNFIADEQAYKKQYKWDIPDDINSSDCKIKITDIGNSSVSDVSDNFFGIISIIRNELLKFKIKDPAGTVRRVRLKSFPLNFNFTKDVINGECAFNYYDFAAFFPPLNKISDIELLDINNQYKGHVKLNYTRDDFINNKTVNAIIYVDSKTAAEVGYINGNGWDYFSDQNEKLVYMLIPPYENFDSLRLDKEPVLFVHGIYGTYPTWGENPKNIYSQYDGWQLYYPYDMKISECNNILKKAVDEILTGEALDTSNYNFANINIVAHSMGGLVSRYYIQSNNDQKVRKLLMLGTPNNGSFISHRLLSRLLFAETLGDISFFDNESPAHFDMNPGSNLLNYLTTSTIKPLVNEDIKKTYLIIAGTKSISGLNRLHHETKDHEDGVVSVSSASLLDKSIPLATKRLNHLELPEEVSSELIDSFLKEDYYPSLTNGWYNIIDQKVDGFYLSNSEWLKDDDANPDFNKEFGMLYLNFPGIDANSKLSLKHKTQNIYKINAGASFVFTDIANFLKNSENNNYFTNNSSGIGLELNSNPSIMLKFYNTHIPIPFLCAIRYVDFKNLQTNWRDIILTSAELDNLNSRNFLRPFFSLQNSSSSSSQNEFYVDNSIDSVTFYLSSTAGDTAFRKSRFTLTDPNNNIIDSITAVGSRYYSYFSDTENCFAYYCIKKPISGNWKVNYNKGLDSPHVLVPIMSPVNASIVTEDTSYSAGDSVKFTVQITNPAGISNVQVNSNLFFKPRNSDSTFEIGSIILSQQDDSIFTGSFVSTAVGEYNITADFSCTFNSQNIQRRTGSSVGVNSILSPVTVFPKRDSTSAPAAVNFKWLKSRNAIRYDFVVYKLGDTVAFIQQSNLTDTICSVSGLEYNTHYLWQVRARTLTDTSRWSEGSVFTTIISIPSEFELSSPSDNSAGHIQPLNFSWLRSSNAANYVFQLSNDSLFTSIIVQDSTLYDTSKVVESLSSLSKYYWRVRAKNDAGYSDFSAIWSFKTLGIPNIVNPIYPKDTSLNNPIKQLFRWTKLSDLQLENLSFQNTRDNVESTGNYWLEFTPDTTNISLIQIDSTLNDTSKYVSNLNYLTDYYWRVKAKNDAGWGNFSSWKKFRTLKKSNNYFLKDISTGTGIVSDFGLTNIIFENNVTTAGTIKVTYYPVKPVTEILPGNIYSLSGYYWQVENSGANINNGFIKIKLNNIGGAYDYSQLRWLKRNNPWDNWQDIGGQISSGYLVNTIPFDSFGEFAIASTSIQSLNSSFMYVKLSMQGLYNNSSEMMNRSDTVKGYLMNSNSPYNTIDSSVAIIDSSTLEVLFEFRIAQTGNYFLRINHFNSIETWSKNGGEVFNKETTMNYDFTTSQSQAFGNNMIQIDTLWCIYSGDVNQDGAVDASDVSMIDNDATNFISGYVTTDLTGDGFVDGTDFAIADNNAASFVSVVRP